MINFAAIVHVSAQFDRNIVTLSNFSPSVSPGGYYTQILVGVFRWGSKSLTLNMTEKPKIALHCFIVFILGRDKELLRKAANARDNVC